MNKLLVVLLIIGLVALPAEGFGKLRCMRKAQKAKNNGADACVIIEELTNCLDAGEGVALIVNDIVASMGIVC